MFSIFTILFLQKCSTLDVSHGSLNEKHMFRCLINAELLLMGWWFQIVFRCWFSEFHHFVREQLLTSVNTIVIPSSPFHVFSSGWEKHPVLPLAARHTITILGDGDFITFDVVTHIRYFSLLWEITFYMNQTFILFYFDYFNLINVM